MFNFKPTCSKLGDLQSSTCGPLVSPVSKNTFDVCCLDLGERGALEYGSIDPSHAGHPTALVGIMLNGYFMSQVDWLKTGSFIY